MIEKTLKERGDEWKDVCCMGYQAALDGRNSTFNPYKNLMNSTEYRLWDAGWEAGLRYMVQIGLKGVEAYRLNMESVPEPTYAPVSSAIFKGELDIDKVVSKVKGNKVLGTRNGGEAAS